MTHGMQELFAQLGRASCETGLPSHATRRERDSLGGVDVPTDHLWGAQT